MSAYADCPNYETCGNQMWIGEGSVGLCDDCSELAEDRDIELSNHSGRDARGRFTKHRDEYSRRDVAILGGDPSL